MSLSTIILTKNEQNMIANCIECLRWSKEIIVIDDGSTDDTVEIVKRLGVTVIAYEGENNFSAKRNIGYKHATGDWILYIDADERVTPKLASAIQAEMQQGIHDVYILSRKNIHYGKHFQYGGWQHDTIERLFKKTALQKWTGKVHETPIYTGTVGNIQEPLLHLTHRNMVDGLRKTIEWTGIEAELHYKNNHKKVTLITLFRKPIMEFIRRAFFKKGWKDGMEGWIEAMVQAMNTFIVYERLWELQQKPRLEKKYEVIEQHIAKSWKQT